MKKLVYILKLTEWSENIAEFNEGYKTLGAIASPISPSKSVYDDYRER